MKENNGLEMVIVNERTFSPTVFFKSPSSSFRPLALPSPIKGHISMRTADHHFLKTITTSNILLANQSYFLPNGHKIQYTTLPYAK
jgi:hypothetical protein